MKVEVPFFETVAHRDRDREEHLVYEKESKNPNLTRYPYKLTAISKISLSYTSKSRTALISDFVYRDPHQYSGSHRPAGLGDMPAH